MYLFKWLYLQNVGFSTSYSLDGLHAEVLALIFQANPDAKIKNLQYKTIRVFGLKFEPNKTNPPYLLIY